MIRLDAATVLLQWATGGLLFCWVTTRGRTVSLGYGWLLRGTYGLIAAGAAYVGLRYGDGVPVREASSIGVVLATGAALVVSVRRREAGVAGEREHVEKANARITAMTGIERNRSAGDASAKEFPPVLDLIAPAIGVVGLVAGGIDAGHPAALSVARVAGRRPLPRRHQRRHAPRPLVPRAAGPGPGIAARPGPLAHVAVAPRGGRDAVADRDALGDQRHRSTTATTGSSGWMWVACAVTTIGLVFVTRAALKERQYSAVMAATGLLYLAILTGFGQDLVARAVLA